MFHDNQTHFSDPDPRCDCYYANFEYYPFHEGASYSIFKGVFNGEGPSAGKFCVVKTITGRRGEESDWDLVLKRAHKAQDLAEQFNKVLGYNAITFLTPLKTQMEHVFTFDRLLRFFIPHEKRLKNEEWVTIEPLLSRHEFESFSYNTHKKGLATKAKKSGYNEKRHPAAGNESTEPLMSPSNIVTSAHIAQAFSHFTWHMTGELVVVGLQGTCDGHSYTLTNPTIHSVRREFGATDGSSQEIRQFFAYHRCTNICSNWATYSSVNDKLTNTLYQGHHSLSDYLAHNYQRG